LKKRSRYINNHCGYAVIFLLVILPFEMMLVIQTLKFSRFIERKIKLQNGVDAALLSGIAVLADGLNTISKLNNKLIHYHKLLIVVQAGTIIMPHPGMILSQEMIVASIKMIAYEQDVIKWSRPLLALVTAYAFARKNESPHLLLFPFVLQYAIQRQPPIQNLPAPYKLKYDYQNHSTWQGMGFYYRGSYKAFAKASLKGSDLKSPDWRGILSE